MYNGNLPSMLSNVFPEIPWDITKFSKVPKNTWKSSENYRKFLDSLFDELKLKSWEDWYNVSPEVNYITSLIFGNLVARK